jgi:hypothetical protein
MQSLQCARVGSRPSCKCCAVWQRCHRGCSTRMESSRATEWSLWLRTQISSSRYEHTEIIALLARMHAA